jgi:hypothetical protein
MVDGAEVILNNPGFVEAAARLFGVPTVRPTTVVINVNAPMSAGAVHVDIPSFCGANRDQYPLRILQAMGTSGLFERWRIVEAGIVTWFYDGLGGAYDYWPDGLDGDMHSEQPPFENVALVADNDRMYHRIGWIGDRSDAPSQFVASAVIEHGGESTWTVTDAGTPLATYPDDRVRISVLWKAQVPQSTGDLDPLTSDDVVEIFAADLAERGIDIAPPTAPLEDEAWLDRLHAIHYPVLDLDERQHDDEFDVFESSPQS